jgi:hypothetical protein
MMTSNSEFSLWQLSIRSKIILTLVLTGLACLATGRWAHNPAPIALIEHFQSLAFCLQPFPLTISESIYDTL